MKLCYIDESGDLGTILASQSRQSQPVLVIGALFLDSDYLHQFTRHYLNLKARFFPEVRSKLYTHLQMILPEIKGSEIRKNILRGSSRERRHAIGFLDHIVKMLEVFHVRTTARIYVKRVGASFNGENVYNSAIQNICRYFHHYLTTEEDTGICIADSRSHSQNLELSRSVFTRKFKTNSELPRIVESLTFGDSKIHAGLQICDIFCSALLFPIAAYAYCLNHFSNIHAHPKAAYIRSRYGARLESMQYRFQNSESRTVGGLVVSDYIGQQSGARMFR